VSGLWSSGNRHVSPALSRGVCLAPRGAGAPSAPTRTMHPLEALDVSSRVAKRAQYEAFEFTLADDDILVRNRSHADPSEHEYLVNVDEGVPVSCTCPADTHYAGACKHRVAVAIRRPVLDAATGSRPPAVPDGGTQPDTSSADSGPVTEGDLETDSLSTQQLARLVSEDCTECLDGFPCWDCFRTAR